MMFAVVGRNLLEAAPPDGPDDEPERRAALEAMRAGSVDALWNLGTIAVAHGFLDAAYVWWLLAATDGDHAALHANAVLLAGRDRDEEAAAWFELAGEARSGTMARLAVTAAELVTYGLGVRRQDLDASDECLRRAAATGYAEGAYFYGLRILETDLTEGIHLLLEAATAHAEVSSHAAAKLGELRRQLGARRYWAAYAKAARRRLSQGPLVPHQP
jgi:TPR repeat protein